MTYGDIFELMDAYEEQTGDRESLEPFALWLVTKSRQEGRSAEVPSS